MLIPDTCPDSQILAHLASTIAPANDLPDLVAHLVRAGAAATTPQHIAVLKRCVAALADEFQTRATGFPLIGELFEAGPSGRWNAIAEAVTECEARERLLHLQKMLMA